MKNSLRTTRLTILIIQVSFILLAILLSIWFIFACRIKTIEINGCIKSEQNNILISANIKEGSHIYTINESEIEKKIKDENPYVYSVDIRKSFPSKIIINIEESTPSFYTFNNGQYFVLSQELRILEINRKQESSFTTNLILLSLPKFNQIKAGEYVYIENDNVNRIYYDIVSTFTKSELFSKTKELNIVSRFDITQNYDSKYTIVYGSYTDFKQKLTNCTTTISYLKQNSPEASGTIYSYTPKETSFEPN